MPYKIIMQSRSICIVPFSAVQAAFTLISAFVVLFYAPLWLARKFSLFVGLSFLFRMLSGNADADCDCDSDSDCDRDVDWDGKAAIGVSSRLLLPLPLPLGNSERHRSVVAAFRWRQEGNECQLLTHKYKCTYYVCICIACVCVYICIRYTHTHTCMFVCA